MDICFDRIRKETIIYLISIWILLESVRINLKRIESNGKHVHIPYPRRYVRSIERSIELYLIDEQCRTRIT
jgi:hypothetical protein